MGSATQFLNQKGVKSAIIEVINLDATEIDETDPLHYNRDLSGTEDYPYKKTYSGFLQTGYSRYIIHPKSILYASLGVMSLLI